MSKLLITILFMVSFSSMAANDEIQVFMAGDSTMAIKQESDFPETGWGMPFSIFFDDSVTVINRAKNGRSTRTFISEGLWESITSELKQGDYVIIQFGHNDESKSKTDRYSSPDQYKQNLTNFIEQVRAKKAHPLLMTPVTRRYFDSEGHLKETHKIYSGLVRDVAAKTNVAFIDMDQVTRQHFQALGDERSRVRYMQLAPNAHPNYPQGRDDNTHFTELGAREVAQLALAQMRKINHPLVDKVRAADPRHLK